MNNAICRYIAEFSGCSDRFKHPAWGAEMTNMTPDSAIPSGRFRAAKTHVVADTPVERIRRLLDDGEQLCLTMVEEVNAAVAASDWAGVLELVDVARQVEQYDYSYAVTKLAATKLIEAGRGIDRSRRAERARPIDLATGLLVQHLSQSPHEPAMLDLLGIAAFELYDFDIARSLFTVAAKMEPDHPTAAQHLQLCNTVARAATRRDLLRPSDTPTWARARGSAKTIVKRARATVQGTISLCMIVKNEEEYLDGCLSAAAAFVDEMVIVDTGSTDRTKEIAASHGARVFDFEWTGSFSEARNETLRHATGDWVLWLDADEFLVVDDGPQLRALARRTWVEGFHIIETHALGDGSDGQASHAPMRLFQRRETTRWEHPVHEQVVWTAPLWLPERRQYSTVRVNHYGYMAHVVDDRDKRARNLELLHAQVEQERSAFVCFNIGTEYAAMGSWPEAQRWFDEALELGQQEPGWDERGWTPLLVQRLIVCRHALGDLDGAIRLADQGLEWWPEYTDLVYERALCHRAAGRWQSAADDARRALAMGDAPARYVSIDGKGSFQAEGLLGTALVQLGERESARAHLEAAVRSAPHQGKLVDTLTNLLLEDGMAAREVSQRLDTLAGGATSTSVDMHLGVVFHEAGALEQAAARYDRVLASRPGHGGALAARSELELVDRRFEDAYESGMAIDLTDRMAGVGARSAFLAAVALQDRDRVRAANERISQHTLLPVTERAFYAAWHQQIEPRPDGIDVLLPTTPDVRQLLLANLQGLARLNEADAFEQLHALVPRVIPDERERTLFLADLYLGCSFADMAGDELLTYAERFGTDAPVLTRLGKVATLKQMWEDAVVLLSESLELEPHQPDVVQLLKAVQERAAA